MSRSIRVQLRPVLIASVFCLLATIAVGQQATPPTETTKASIPVYTRVEEPADGVTLAELSNGLTVLVQENHVAPVATVRCYVKNTGGAFEGRYLGMGISHLVEHLVSGGTTTNRTEKEIEKIVDTFGGATNAYTSSSLTAYFIDCSARHAMTCIDLIADSMQHVKFEQAEFDREFKVVQRELSDGHVGSEARVQWKLSQSNGLHRVHPVAPSDHRLSRGSCAGIDPPSGCVDFLPTTATCRTTRSSWWLET